jgi:hypothetical protein
MKKVHMELINSTVRYLFKQKIFRKIIELRPNDLSEQLTFK